MNIRKNIAAALIALSAIGAASSANAEVITRNDQVESRATDTWSFQFSGYEAVTIALRGDRDTDLDLEVRDENGHVIATSDGASDRESVRFTPARNGTFKVRVKNLGNIYNVYRLTVRTGSDIAGQFTTPNVLQTRF